MTEWIALLESNNLEDVENAKQKFHEQFNIVKDSWLLNGLYEYYLSSNSVRSMEILVNVREPHHIYLFEKLSESIKGSKTDTKVQALTLLGHILRNQPTWLYRITEHHLLKDLLKLLKNETDILSLVSALLVLIVLLPMIPSLMGQFLPDVFEIFSRLAAWNCNNPGKVIEEQMVHMQVALYALFQRLYGMYPCNFLAYLRNQYREKDLLPIFKHTIQPMLDTVKMHPLLVTASKDNETTTARWKKMGAHDVIVECERFSLDVGDRCPHESCHLTSSFRSRSGTTNSGTFESPYQLQTLKHATYHNEKDFFSPSMMFQCQTPPVSDSSVATTTPLSHFQVLAGSSNLQSQEGTSPPEAAIEATPETTPIRDVRMLLNHVHPQNSNVVRALNSFNQRNRSVGSATTTPIHSQPSSPMRKDASPFNFSYSTDRHMSAFGLPKKDSYADKKLQRVIQERNQVIESQSDNNETVLRVKTPVLPSSSQLRIIPASSDNSVPNSPVQRIESPVSQEDEEVLAIVRQGELSHHSDFRQCDSVLQETDAGRGTEEDLEDCEQEHGSPCAAGGLHMPNSKSLNNFAKRVRRLRYHSQCNAESEQPEISAGSSPGNCATFPKNLTVRRANSCPEMKKSPVIPTKDNISKTLDETDEEMNQENENRVMSNGFDSNSKDSIRFRQKRLVTSETQTENFWPMPYEHLFLGIFPSLENNEVRPSPAPSPAPLNLQQQGLCPPVSVYEILDKFIEIAVHQNDKDVIKNLRLQLQLLHQQLLFERHRRETHAFRNRRLLADARNTRALEEHNSALRDQVQLQQNDIDNLKKNLEIIKTEKGFKEKEHADVVKLWENRFKTLQQECKMLKEKNDNLESALEKVKKTCSELDNKWQKAEAELLDATTEVKIAREQARAGEKGRAELEQVNRELLLSGEINLKYQERLNEIPLLRRSEQELVHLTESYNQELKNVNQQLESKVIYLEAYKSRIRELEYTVSSNEQNVMVQKGLLNSVKEEYHEKLDAVESKYQTQLAINRAMEEKILELWQKMELSGRRAVHSPDTSSCHEVNATMTDKTSTAAGLSPHSSPLSASLASSEGSMAFTPDLRDMKNLQVIVDQKETVISKPQENSGVPKEPGPSNQQYTKHD